MRILALIILALIMATALATAAAGLPAELDQAARQTACKPGGFTLIRFNGGSEARGKADASFSVFLDSSATQGDSAFRAAMSTWSSVSGSRWRYSLAGYRDGVSSSDGQMSVLRGGRGFPNGVLATTLVTAVGSTGEIVDSDIFFNPEMRFSTAPGPGEFDFESVALHEMGHGLGLDHNDACSPARTVMQSALSSGALVRSLAGPEQEGARFLYPGFNAGGEGGSGVVVTASPSSLLFSGAVSSGNPAPQTISLTGAPGALWVAVASATGGRNWLRIDSDGGRLPALIGVSISTDGLTPGFYAGRVSIASGNTQRDVGVSLNLASPPGPALELSPARLSFTSLAGGSAAVTGSLSLSGTAGLAWSATASAQGGDWLRVVPSSGTLPATLNVILSPAGLSVQIHSGTIRVSAAGLTRETAVALEITAQPKLTVDPAGVLLTAQAGSAAPGCANVKIGALADAAVEWTARAGAPWLSVSPPSGRSPSVLGICASPAGLIAGDYSSSVSIAAAAPAVGESLAVSFAVTPPVAVAEGGVVNAASLAAGQPVAPGAILSVFGTNLAAKVESAPGFPLPLELGGSRVQIGGLTARLLYVSPEQINLVAPAQLGSLAGSATTLTVYQDRLASPPARVRVAAAAPGVFTLLRQGAGAGAVTHADGSVVSRLAPVAAEETVLIYLTGLGRLEPPIAEGAAAPAQPLSRAAEPVRVLVDGEAARVEFAGASPGFSGLQVVAATLPARLARRYPEIVVEAGGVPSNRFTAGGPSLLEVTPGVTRAGTEATLTLRGLHLPESSLVQAGNLKIPASVEPDGRTLRVVLPASVLSAPGTLSLTVADADAPGEPASNPVFLTIER